MVRLEVNHSRRSSGAERRSRMDLSANWDLTANGVRHRPQPVTTAGGRGRRRAGAGGRPRGCRSASSRGMRGRGAPGSCGGRRPPRGDASHTRAGGCAGGGQAAERARVEPPAAHREEERVARAAREVRTAVAEPAAEPPRGLLAHRHERAPCRPCRARAPAPDRGRRRRGRARRSPPSGGRTRRRAPRGQRSGAASGSSPSSRSTALSTSLSRGVSGSRRGLRGASAASGTCSGPRAWRTSERTAERRRPIVVGASPRRRPAELGRVVRERAHVDVVEAELPSWRASRRSLGGRRRRLDASRPTAPGSRGSGRSRPRCPRLPCSRRLPETPPMRITLALVLAVAITAAIVVARQVDDESSATTTGAVTLVGDSLNVGIEPYLAKELPGWRVDAHDTVGRATAEGVDELRARRRSLAPVVVVSLGTNDAEGSEDEFRHARRRRDRGRRAGPLPRLGDRRPRRRRAHRLRPRAPRRKRRAPERAPRRVGVARLGRSVAPRRRPRPRHPGRLRPTCGGDGPRDSRLLGHRPNSKVDSRPYP